MFDDDLIHCEGEDTCYYLNNRFNFSIRVGDSYFARVEQMKLVEFSNIIDWESEIDG